MTLQVGVLNVDGYYDPLLSLFNKGVEEGFITSKARELVIHAATPQELIAKIAVIATILEDCQKHSSTFLLRISSLSVR
jgi:predicted Rossmann-fold nucleotide-binding protein